MEKFTPKKGVITREIEGLLVLYDSKKDAVHTLNTTAQFVWEHIEIPPTQIVEKLQTSYHVSQQIAQQDVEHVLGQFETLGLIQKNTQQ